MCGIVGYYGTKDAKEIILKGLSQLEYRGYDSSGIAVLENASLKILKKKGPLSELYKALEHYPIAGTIGIGHTRWATHGAASDLNAHPHFNKKQTLQLDTIQLDQ